MPRKAKSTEGAATRADARARSQSTKESGRQQPAPTLKDHTETIKNVFDIVRSFLVVAAILVLVFDRGMLGRILDRMNASKIAIGSLTVERDVVAQSIKANADALPKTQEALRAATGELTVLRASYKATADALRASQTALAEMQVRLGSTTAPASVAHAQQLSAPLLAQVNSRLQSLDRASAQVKTASDSASHAIRELPGAANTGSGFGVVFGGHRNLDSAGEQLARGKALRLGDPHLFSRSGIYRSVAVFGSRESANAALPNFRALPFAAEAYVVNLGSWCPGVEPVGDVVDCGL